MSVGQPIRLIVVDDSAVFREIMLRGLSSDPSIEVAGTAQDPYEAVEWIERVRPDVMICDVEMPRMNGVEFVRRLLPQHPMPVIVVSSLSHAALDALEAGAVDFVKKPDMRAVQDVERFLMEIIRKAKAAVKSNPRAALERAEEDVTDRRKSYGTEDDLIAIGASTGGTEAIHRLLAALPPSMPGIAIVQHIPPVFSRMFAERLDATTPFRVKEAQTGDVLRRGVALVAPGDRHMRIVKTENGFVVRCDEGEKINGHCPSVDVMFESAAKQAGPRAIGVLLTGMGYDGAKGLLAIRRKGGRTIGQNASTSVVYGMPKAAYEVGAVEYQLPLSQIAGRICSLLG